ncbi:major facilitator superfamily domain-containing protein [Amanita rubescens]|nr:major facilitator superfamily domain-containing protein [Amanita rubescens]
MASEGNLTIYDIEKVDDCDYDKELPEGKPLEEPTDFPEGGLRGWMTLVGSFLFQFCSYGYTNAFGVFNDYYVRIYLGEKYSSSDISWIGSVQIAVSLLMGILSGRAFDTGYFYHIIICGTLLFAFSLFMLSLSQPEQYYQVFLAQGIANSIAIGMIYIPALAIVSHYFRRRRPFALGVSAAGSATGGAIHPIILNQLFYGRTGFHNGVRASAGFTLGLMIIGILLMKPRLPPKKRHDGSWLISFRTFMREPAYALVTLGTLLMFMGLYFPMFYLQLYAIKRNVDSTLAFYSLTILNGGSAVGRIVPNLIVNKYGVMNTIVICSICCTVLIFCFLAVKSAVGIVLFAAVYGFFGGAFIGLLTPTLAVQAKKDSEIGERIGICFALAAIGGLIGNPIAGALLTSSYTWWKPIIFAGVTVGLGSTCFFGARLFLVKEKGTGIV